jgi:hypothetical protein
VLLQLTDSAGAIFLRPDCISFVRALNAQDGGRKAVVGLNMVGEHQVEVYEDAQSILDRLADLGDRRT